jgi:hydroxyacylglutathione hydrolase
MPKIDRAESVMLLERIEDDGLAQYSYVVGSEGAAEVAVVDPRRDVDVYLDWASAHGARITHVLETHIHADFASGARELAERTGAQLLVSGHDRGETFEVTGPHQDLLSGTRIRVGGVEIEAVHTPGHTPEHLSFLIYTGQSPQPAAMLSGDFLFVGSVGRPDLLGDEETAGLALQLFDSVRTLAAYPDSLTIHPGHGAGSMCGSGMGQAPTTTLGQERVSNPYLDPALSRERFVQKLLASAPPFPPYYRRMKRVNAEGPRRLQGIPGQQALEIDDFRRRLDAGGVAIDLRDQKAFGEGHVPGAFGINAERMLSMWAAWVVPYDTPLLLVGDEEQVEKAARGLVRVGLDDVDGYLRGGMPAWTAAGLPVARTPQTTPEQLQRALGAPGAPQVLDVRTDDEWREGHLPGALHIMGGYLPERTETVPRDSLVVVMCGSGFRSTLAASVLERAGFTNVANLTGGMKAWKDAGLPTVRDAEAQADARPEAR